MKLRSRTMKLYTSEYSSSNSEGRKNLRMKFMMKKSIITLFLSVLCLTGFGQAEPRVGIKFGYSRTRGSASGDGTNNVEYSAGNGASVGIFRDFKLGNSIGLESGLIFDHYQTNYFVPFVEAKDMFSYLSIPVILQFQTSSTFNINTGPQLGILVAAKAKSGSQEEDVKEFTKGSMINWAVGIEFNTKANLDFGFRYLVGLTDINDAKDIINATYKLNTLQVYLGCRL
ncbi:porin family protein [Ekhidna sp.]|uniref:porin family protein n=1 Tax=Ekhidna sp. TaxID=2608089 RepID=UPI003CCC0E0C